MRLKMSMHDWTSVPTGIFHAFHHAWIQSISNSLNGGILPRDFYALPEQQAAGFGPDVLTLQASAREDSGQGPGGTATAVLEHPRTRFMAETEAEFYRRKKSSIVVRHVSGDDIVAMIEIRSPGNKSSKRSFDAFVQKAHELLEARIHLLLIDPLPPGRRDPQGIHAAIWDEEETGPFELPPDKPLTLVAYECALTTRAYIEPIAVGDPLPNMPLFLEPELYVNVPLEETYRTAFEVQPERWRRVLEPERTM
jgi:hypothetical protein